MKVHITDEHQDMYEWACHHDLKLFWDDKCLFGACEEVEELYKVFLGQCIDLHGSHICPGTVHNLTNFDHSLLGEHERIFGDRIMGLGHIGRSFRGSRCLKVSSTFLCDDDVNDMINTGCASIHAHDANGHHLHKVCDD